MAQRGINGQDCVVVSLKKTCDVCGFALPKGCANRHPSCEDSARTADEFCSVRKDQRSLFESVVRDLGELDAARLLRRYDNVLSARDLYELLIELMKSARLNSRRRDLCLLRYYFLPFTPDHPE